MASTLKTIGYEEASLADFIATLNAAEITTLLDVRQIASSRRKGFSKTALAAALDKAGIDYVHLRGLGDPKEGREAARSGDYKKFEKIFINHLKSSIALDDLEKAVSFVMDSSVCLLCYERDPNLCHRKFVAIALSEITDAQITHIGVQKGLANAESKRRSGKNSNSSQGAPTRRSGSRRNSLLRGTDSTTSVATTLSG